LPGDASSHRPRLRDGDAPPSGAGVGEGGSLPGGVGGALAPAPPPASSTSGSADAMREQETRRPKIIVAILFSAFRFGGGANPSGGHQLQLFGAAQLESRKLQVLEKALLRRC
jgi:hypothetical protein